MHPVWRAIALTGMALTLSAGSAQAQTLDQQYGGPANCNAGVGSGFLRAQTFTPSLTGSLDQVDLFLSNRGAVQPLTVEIHDVVGGAPGATVLATASLPTASVPAGPSWVSVTFTTPAELQAGIQYAIVLSTSDPIANGYAWSCASPGGYTGGDAYDQLPSSSGWEQTTLGGQSADFLFRTYAPVEYPSIVEVQSLRVSRSMVSFRVITPTVVQFTLERRVAAKRYRRVGRFRVLAKRGANRVRVPRRLNGRYIRKGVLRMSARAIGRAGSGPVTRRLVRLR